MASSGRTVLAVALVGVLGVCGCYGSTEPATNVTFDAAQLNARGTANNGPASSYFEYWPTNTPQAKITTSTVQRGGKPPERLHAKRQRLRRSLIPVRG
jgi:hypothetical protein